MQKAPLACPHTLHLGRKNTLLRAQIAHFARRLFFERERKDTLFGPVTKVGWVRKWAHLRTQKRGNCVSYLQCNALVQHASQVLFFLY